MSGQKEKDEGHPLAEKISGLGQKIIGEVEMIGGILTADPNTAAEGEFNLEVGDLRGEIEEELEAGKGPQVAEPADDAPQEQ